MEPALFEREDAKPTSPEGGGNRPANPSALCPPEVLDG